jgi:hypothetical protein
VGVHDHDGLLHSPVPEREKADLLHAGNLLIFRLVCDLKGGSWRKAAIHTQTALRVMPNNQSSSL